MKSDKNIFEISRHFPHSWNYFTQAALVVLVTNIMSGFPLSSGSSIYREWSTPQRKELMSEQSLYDAYLKGNIMDTLPILQNLPQGKLLSVTIGEMEEKEARLEEGRDGRGVGRRGEAIRLGFRAEGEGEKTSKSSNEAENQEIVYLWRQPDVCNMRFGHFWGWRRINHHLKLRIGEVAVLVLVSISKHLFDLLLVHMNRKTLHQMDKILLFQWVLFQSVLLGLVILWIRVCAAHHLLKATFLSISKFHILLSCFFVNLVLKP